MWTCDFRCGSYLPFSGLTWLLCIRTRWKINSFCWRTLSAMCCFFIYMRVTGETGVDEWLEWLSASYRSVLLWMKQLTSDRVFVYSCTAVKCLLSMLWYSNGWARTRSSRSHHWRHLPTAQGCRHALLPLVVYLNTLNDVYDLVQLSVFKTACCSTVEIFFWIHNVLEQNK